MGKAKTPWQEIDEVLQRFGDNLKTARKKYYEFMEDGIK
jgi:hypothetical protein